MATNDTPFPDVSDTVQTVPEAGHSDEATGQQVSTKELQGVMFFELAQDSENRWRWGLWTTNGKLMAMSAHAYSRRNDCRDACDVIMDDVQKGMKVVVRDYP